MPSRPWSRASAMARPARRRAQRGLTLVELTVSLVIGALIVGALVNVASGALAVREQVRTREDALEEARYAMERMVRAAQGTARLMVPLADNPATGHDESQREPGVLAVTLDPAIDRDANGIADADNDGDGRIDEDPGDDATNDGAHGVVGIDDDNDGTVDEGAPGADNDEDGVAGDDVLNGVDDDGDGSVDEDPRGDAQGDGAPGIAGVDDDGDGTVDEGASSDDDEDGSNNEDWWDPVVFRLAGTDLVERVPLPFDENGDATVNGLDFVERTLAANVSRFRVVRLPAGGGKPPLVQITIDVTVPDGDVVSLTRTVRVGGGT